MLTARGSSERGVRQLAWLIAACALTACAETHEAHPPLPVSPPALPTANAGAGAQPAHGSETQNNPTSANSPSVSADGSGCALATQRGERVVPYCATEVVLREAADGYRPPPPAGSQCNGASSYTLDLTSVVLTWSACHAASYSEPYTLDVGTRTLNMDELFSTRAALDGVTVAAPTAACGYDLPTLTIDVTLPGATRSYTDSFYACLMKPGVIYVDNIDALFKALEMLAHP